VKINKNILKLKPSSTLLINEKVKELRKKGYKTTHFGFGQSPFPIYKDITNELKNNAANNHYLSVKGLQDLRDQLSKFLRENQGIDRESELIFIGPGSKELLYQSVLIFEGHFLIPKGSWVSYIPQIKSKGASYSVLETKLEDNFKLKANSLDTFLSTHKGKEYILVLNSPNNPTGAVYSDDEYKSLAEVCRKYQVIVLSDEIYSQINFKNEFSPSISNYYSEGTILFGGLSKVFSAGGYRLGFMSIPKEFEHLSIVYSSLFSETFSCVSSPVQFAAITAYEYGANLKAYVTKSVFILNQIASYIFSKLSTNNIQCTKPQGAFYMMIGFEIFKNKINSLQINTSTELAHYLLENFNIALLPGSDFGFKSTELFFRLAFVDFDGERLMKLVRKETNIDENFIKENCLSIYNGVQQLIKFIREIS
tara:strand:+ start:48024 stop:49292 length:1269 start_codon:yes stop_codon:yes gene_type:complete